MVNRMPGATWMNYNPSGRASRRKQYSCVVAHVAVAGVSNLRPYSGADWHFYLPKKGSPFQWIDLDLQAWTTGGGNHRVISFESEGGLGGDAAAQLEPWTDDQIEGAAMILAYANETEGVPLRLMRNSLPTERGFGWHRLGCDPYRVSGGELWSSSYGKVCPGNAKIAQAPLIVARAIEIRRGSPSTNSTTTSATPITAAPEDDMTPTQANQLNAVYEHLMAEKMPEYGGAPRSQAILNALGELRKQVGGIDTDLDVPGAPYGWLPAINNKLDALAVQVGAIEAVKGDGGVDVDALAARIAETVGDDVAKAIGERLIGA